MGAHDAKVIPLPVRAATAPAAEAPLPDAVLVIAARDGETWAREALFRRYARTVNDLAFRLLPWDDEADDLVQDTFIAALTGLSRLEEPAAFAGWLRSIAVRTAAKRIRKRMLLVRQD